MTVDRIAEYFTPPSAPRGAEAAPDLRRIWEEARGDPLRKAFEETYRVHPMNMALGTVLDLLTWGGASEAEALAVWHARFGPEDDPLVNVADVQGKGSLLARSELYGQGHGRDRTPLFLIAHPCDVGPEALASAEAVRSLGLTAAVLGPEHSWFGYGTSHFVAYDLRRVRAVCGPRAPAYPFKAPRTPRPWPGTEEAGRLLSPLFPHLAGRPPR